MPRAIASYALRRTTRSTRSSRTDNDADSSRDSAASDSADSDSDQLKQQQQQQQQDQARRLPPPAAAPGPPLPAIAARCLLGEHVLALAMWMAVHLQPTPASPGAAVLRALLVSVLVTIFKAALGGAATSSMSLAALGSIALPRASIGELAIVPAVLATNTQTPTLKNNPENPCQCLPSLFPCHVPWNVAMSDRT